MQIHREWQHDDTTEELGDIISTLLEIGEVREEISCSFNSDDGGEIEVSLPGDTRRFRLVLEEIV